MNKPQLEARVHEIVDRVKKGHPIEDSYVELKSIWPAEHRKAARQLAGHANAAFGNPLLWLIGVDEKGEKITSADNEELSNWYTQVASSFENQFAPALQTSMSVPVEENETVVALYFETDRAPYVIKNGEELEVPWREGNRTRSAKRRDLLRMLAPAVTVPRYDIDNGVLECTWFGSNKWSCRLAIYIVPVSNERFSIPFYCCEGHLSFDDDPEQFSFSGVSLTDPGSLQRLASGLLSRREHGGDYVHRTLFTDSEQIVFDGPGMIDVTGNVDLPRESNDYPEIVVATFSLPIPQADFRPIVVSRRFKRMSVDSEKRQAAYHEIR